MAHPGEISPSDAQKDTRGCPSTPVQRSARLAETSFTNPIGRLSRLLNRCPIDLTCGGRRYFVASPIDRVR